MWHSPLERLEVGMVDLVVKKSIKTNQYTGVKKKNTRLVLLHAESGLLKVERNKAGVLSYHNTTFALK